MINKRKVRAYKSKTKSGDAEIWKFDKTITGKRKKVTKSYTDIENDEAYSFSSSKNKKKSSGKEVNKTYRKSGVVGERTSSSQLLKTKSTTSKSGKVKSRTVTKRRGDNELEYPSFSKKVVKNGVEKKYVAWRNGENIIKRKN